MVVVGRCRHGLGVVARMCIVGAMETDLHVAYEEVGDWTMFLCVCVR